MAHESQGMVCQVRLWRVAGPIPLVPPHRSGRSTPLGDYSISSLRLLLCKQE